MGERPGELERSKIEAPSESVRSPPVAELAVLGVPEFELALDQLVRRWIFEYRAGVKLTIDSTRQLEPQVRMEEVAAAEPGAAEIEEHEPSQIADHAKGEG